jgi:hypothetical protein
MAMSLKINPQKGSLEEDLAGSSKEFRSLIYKITKRNTVKIIYSIVETTKTVYVTDFFPTQKDPNKKTKRS